MNNNWCWLLILLSCCGCGTGNNNGAVPLGLNDCSCSSAMPIPANNGGMGCNDILWLIILICLFGTCGGSTPARTC